jgi:hypothetical protein
MIPLPSSSGVMPMPRIFGKGGLGRCQRIEGVGAEPVEGVVIARFHLFHLGADPQQGETIAQDGGGGAIGEGADLNGHRLVDGAGAAGGRRTGDTGTVPEDVGRNVHMHGGQYLIKIEIDAAASGGCGGRSGAAGGDDGERVAHRSLYGRQGSRCGRCRANRLLLSDCRRAIAEGHRRR